LHAAAPRSLASQFNHGFALLLNGRTDEAAAIFKTVNTRPLNRRQMSFYHLAWFEIYLNQKNFGKARETAGQIDPAHLFPAQLQWFEPARQQLPPEGTAG
jgi:outer membrane PBP1 activator LpoA protein